MIYANSAPVQNNLEQYIPLPMEQMWKAGQAIQERGDKAQQAADQVQIGLASMEADLPGHRQFVNKFATDYKAKASDLLDKYGNNTSDPNFIRESRQLGLQFAADPRLRTIQLANQEYQAKQKIKDTLNSQGKKYIDTNPNATGVDENNNLNSNVGDLKMTNFDEDIDKSFKNLENTTENLGNGLITNKKNLLRNLGTYLTPSGNLDRNNQAISEGLTYYKQQGMNDAQAEQAVHQILNKGLAYGKDSRDYHEEDKRLDMYKFNVNRQDKFALENMREQNRAKRFNQTQIVPTGDIAPSSSPILAEAQGSTKLKAIDDVLGNLNKSGGIKKGSFTAPLSDKSKYPDATIEYSAGDIDASTGHLRVSSNTYNPSESKLVDEARQFFGDKAKNSRGDYLADRTILSRYKDVLKNSQADSFNYSAPVNQKYGKSLTSQYFGDGLEKLGTDYKVVTTDGSGKQTLLEGDEARKALANVDKVSFIGTNASPLGNYVNGTIAATATTKSKTNGANDPRQSIMIIKPMDNNMASQYKYSNLAERAKLSDFTNDDFINNPQTKDLRIIKNKIEYVPQKGLTAGSRMGLTYYPISNGKLVKTTKDKNGKTVSTGLDINDINNSEHSGFYSKVGQSIYTKPEAQNYSAYPNDDE